MNRYWDIYGVEGPEFLVLYMRFFKSIAYSCAFKEKHPFYACEMLMKAVHLRRCVSGLCVERSRQVGGGTVIENIPGCLQGGSLGIRRREIFHCVPFCMVLIIYLCSSNSTCNRDVFVSLLNICGEKKKKPISSSP